ncbi:MAG: MBL fold metallo-hydrolase [Antricoccus sp.]
MSASITLTKFTHACIRLERDGNVLVIDPGVWSEPEALEGAHAVLITHEHFDHFVPERLIERCTADPKLAVFAHPDVAAQLKQVAGQVTAVNVEDRFSAADFDVEAVGGRHADIYDSMPGCANVGFVIDGIYHPGDALHVPDRDISTLLVPASAPWLKLAEAIDFVKAVNPTTAHPIHDALLNERGLPIVLNWLKNATETAIEPLAPGESVTI